MSSESLEIIKLPAHFSQVQLSGLKELVDHHLDNGHQVQFDASGVDRIDGAAVQFLLVVSRLQSSDSHSATRIVNVNEIVVNALDDMGIKDLCKLDTQEVPSTNVAI